MLIGGITDAFVSVVLLLILLLFLSLYHQWREEHFSGDTQDENAAALKTCEQRLVATMVRSTIYLLPPDFDSYGISSRSEGP